MIYQTVTFSDFVDEFVAMNRASQFTYEGLELIYDWLDNMGQDVELDVIAICCDYVEEYIDDYFETEFDDDCIAEVGDDMEKKKELIQEYIENHTFLIGFTEETVVFCEF